MKKILKATLSFLALLPLLFSCNEISEQNNRLIPIEIWYSPYTSADAPLPDDWFGYKLIEEKLGIKLKAIPLPLKKEEQTELILKAASTNTLPDLFMVNRELLVQLAKQDKVARVDKMFSFMPVRTQLMYDEKAKKNGQFDGLTYGLCHSGSIDRNEGVLIRKDWLDNLGLQIPVTLDDYFEVMRRFTLDDPDRNGKDDTYGFGAYLDVSNNEDGLGKRFAPFFGAYGVAGTFNATKNNLGLNIHKPEYYEALAFIRRIVAERYIDPNWTAYKKDDFRDAWKNGRFGIMREQNAALALESNYKAFDEKFPNGEWLLINPPMGPDGKKSVGCYSQSYRTYAVSKRSLELGKIESIAKLLEWMSTSGYNCIAYGREGENFTLDENNKVTTNNLPDMNKAYTKKEVAPLLQLRNMVFYGSDSELEARYPTWYTQNGRPMSALTLLREMQSKNWTQSIGIPACEPELKKFMQTGLLEFIMGRRNLNKENWNEWLKEFDNRGGKVWEHSAFELVESNNFYID